MKSEEKKPHGMNQYKKIWQTINGMKAMDEMIKTKLEAQMYNLEKDVKNIKDYIEHKDFGQLKRIETLQRIVYFISGTALGISLTALIISVL